MKGSSTMKRITVFFIVFVLLICNIVSALADGFSVRNGISFGMSQDEVKKIEEKNGLTGDWNGYTVSKSGGYGGDTVIVYHPDSLAGFSGFDFRDGDSISPEIRYCFVNDSLFRIIYEWYSFCSTDKDKDTAAQYDTLNASLKEKYDLLSENKNNEIKYVDFGQKYTSYLQWVIDDSYTYGFKMGPFTQYLAKDNNGYVDIWLYHYTTKPLAGGFNTDWMYIEYTFCTDSQIQAVFDSVQKIEDERHNDL